MTVTTRGLIDGDSWEKLRRFTGILDSTPTEERPNNFQPGKTISTVKVNVKDIEVLESTEPYAFPIYTIEINQSNRTKSKWGIFSESVNNILDKTYSADQLNPDNPAYIKPSDRIDINYCIGKRVGFVWADGEEGRPKPPVLFAGQEQGDQPTPCWTVYMIEGIGNTEATQSLYDTAVDLLNGKTITEFNQAAMNHAGIRGDGSLLADISKPLTDPNSFISKLVAEGKFTVGEDGKYSKV